MELARSQARLFVVSAPSGAGKTSLVNALIQQDDNLALCVSHTTRDMREGETDGEHYYFVSDDRFSTMVTDGQFLEHATVFGNRYGTAKTEVERCLNQGLDTILEIDWQGAQNVRSIWPDTVSIFVLPPNQRELRKRLTSRGQDHCSVIDQRMRQAVAEMSHYREYTYVVVNIEFETALESLKSIVDAVRRDVKPSVPDASYHAEQIIQNEF